MKLLLIDYMKFLYWGGYKSLSFRSLWFTLRLKRCGLGLIVKKGVRINKPKQVCIGDRVSLDLYASIHLNKISENDPIVKIGNNVLIGAYSSIGCSNKIIIEDDVMFAPHVHITDRNHSYENVNIAINKQPANSPGSVFIGKESWLGYGVQVMPNVKIGKHCVIAAGSIVTRNIPDFSVAVGIPAKVIKKFNLESQKWEKI